MKKTYLQPNTEVVRLNVSELMNQTSPGATVNLSTSGSVDADELDARSRNDEFAGADKSAWTDGLW